MQVKSFIYYNCKKQQRQRANTYTLSFVCLSVGEIVSVAAFWLDILRAGTLKW